MGIVKNHSILLRNHAASKSKNTWRRFLKSAPLLFHHALHEHSLMALNLNKVCTCWKLV